jgi:hypothetical protein
MKGSTRIPHSIELFVLILLLALLFLHSPGTEDVNVFLRWMAATEKYGVIDGYSRSNTTFADRYPPLAFVLLSGIDKVGMVLHLNRFEALKLGLFLFLLLTSASFYAYTRNLFLTTLFQFALTLNSVALGYIDILNAPFLVLSLLALRRGWLVTFAILYSISFTIKFQPLILAPFIVAYIVKIETLRDIRSIDFRQVLRGLLPMLLAPILLLLVFGTTFLSSVGNTVTREFLSGQALNFGWILTYLLHVLAPGAYGALEDGAITLIVRPGGLLSAGPYLIFLLVYGFIFIRFLRMRKTFAGLLAYSLLGYLAYFIFSTDVHENHLFTACILAGLLVLESRRYLLPFLIWALAANLNMFIFYGIDGKGLSFSRVVAGFDVSLLFAIAYVVLFGIYLSAELLHAQESHAPISDSTPSPTIGPQDDSLALCPDSPRTHSPELAAPD